MAFYAHAVIELEDGTKIQRGDSVKKSDVEGFDELLDAGSISEEPYVAPEPEASDIKVAQTVDDDTVVVDGVVYKRASDGASTDEVSK
jgi:hypothetical protein